MYSILHYFAEQAAPDVYAWHFDVPSPYENAWGGMPHHSFDNVMIWSVLKHALAPAHQKTSESIVEAWVKFANDKKPLERFDRQERWIIIKEDGLKMTR
jgi:carboxylesterase type B